MTDRPGEPTGAAVNTETCPTCMRPMPIPQRGDHDYGMRLSAPPVDAQPVEPLTAEEALREAIRDVRYGPGLDLMRDAKVARWQQALDAARAGDGLLREALEPTRPCQNCGEQLTDRETHWEPGGTYSCAALHATATEEPK